MASIETVDVTPAPPDAASVAPPSGASAEPRVTGDDMLAVEGAPSVDLVKTDEAENGGENVVPGIFIRNLAAAFDALAAERADPFVYVRIAMNLAANLQWWIRIANAGGLSDGHASALLQRQCRRWERRRVPGIGEWRGMVERDLLLLRAVFDRGVPMGGVLWAGDSGTHVTEPTYIVHMRFHSVPPQQNGTATFEMVDLPFLPMYDEPIEFQRLVLCVAVSPRQRNALIDFPAVETRDADPGGKPVVGVQLSAVPSRVITGVDADDAKNGGGDAEVLHLSIVVTVQRPRPRPRQRGGELRFWVVGLIDAGEELFRVQIRLKEIDGAATFAEFVAREQRALTPSHGEGAPSAQWHTTFDSHLEPFVTAFDARGNEGGGVPNHSRSSSAWFLESIKAAPRFNAYAEANAFNAMCDAAVRNLVFPSYRSRGVAPVGAPRTVPFAAIAPDVLATVGSIGEVLKKAVASRSDSSATSGGSEDRVAEWLAHAIPAVSGANWDTARPVALVALSTREFSRECAASVAWIPDTIELARLPSHRRAAPPNIANTPSLLQMCQSLVLQMHIFEELDRPAVDDALVTRHQNALIEALGWTDVVHPKFSQTDALLRITQFSIPIPIRPLSEADGEMELRAILFDVLLEVTYGHTDVRAAKEIMWGVDSGADGASDGNVRIESLVAFARNKVPKLARALAAAIDAVRTDMGDVNGIETATELMNVVTLPPASVDISPLVIATMFARAFELSRRSAVSFAAGRDPVTMLAECIYTFALPLNGGTAEEHTMWFAAIVRTACNELGEWWGVEQDPLLVLTLQPPLIVRSGVAGGIDGTGGIAWNHMRYSDRDNALRAVPFSVVSRRHAGALLAVIAVVLASFREGEFVQVTRLPRFNTSSETNNAEEKRAVLEGYADYILGSSHVSRFPGTNDCFQHLLAWWKAPV